MEKFPENQNNNSESEKPAEKKGGFKNKLKVWLGLGATAAALTMTGCGKDANATNNVPTPTVDDGPKTESNIEDAGITTSQDVDTVEFGDGTSVDISDSSSTSEVAVEEESNGEVDPAKYWEGDTFHLDEYAEALGYTIKPSSMLHRYGDGNTKVLIIPAAEKIEFWEYEETIFEAKYGNHDYQYLREGDINIEFNDNIIGKNKSRLGEYIETLQWFSNTDNPYSFEEALPYWHK